jgi:hypothetical protein
VATAKPAPPAPMINMSASAFVMSDREGAKVE